MQGDRQCGHLAREVAVDRVVLDEEHEWSYKQVDPQPRYHAREAAERLCALTGARLILGSATPDIVTYHRSELGSIQRVELGQRLAPLAGGGIGEGRLPNVEIVDMREELRGGNRSVFSRPLRRAIHAALGAGEQTILFVNRRGSARFLRPGRPPDEVYVSLRASNRFVFVIAFPPRQ